ncbi:HTH-type transcriptional regulator GalR [Cyberlindnera fabianii]|uniref:HTH-type transcriptional regulator GalR n=1 Tax=Cyberlindnera fabianii TaxID=36022 RepID=A0A1V2LB48_CYBFA|nr:HTH-type transcriptional regulator GalR [Cyberlindnera fabianii]
MALHTRLLDLPTELLIEICQFDSLQPYENLLQTSKRFHDVVRERVLVIGHSAQRHLAPRYRSLDLLRRVNIDELSLHSMIRLISRYDYFVFDMYGNTTPPLSTFSTSANIKILKIMIEALQARRKHHTIIVESANFNADALMRTLTPKFNSVYLEFYLPKTREINGFEDLRILDNTRCYMRNLERLTIGSLSFQLFECNAPKLKTFSHSHQVITRVIYDTVNVRRVSYSNFLSTLAESCAKSLTVLEVLGYTEPEVLKQYENLEVLHIYGDHVTTTFDAGAFPNLKELVMSKCDNLKEVINIGGAGQLAANQPNPVTSVSISGMQQYHSVENSPGLCNYVSVLDTAACDNHPSPGFTTSYDRTLPLLHIVAKDHRFQSS